MTQIEKQKEELKSMIEMSGFNVVLRMMATIAEEKSVDTKNWNQANKELWAHLAQIAKEASYKIEDVKAAMS